MSPFCFPLLGTQIRISKEILWSIDFPRVTFTTHSWQWAGLEVAAPKHIMINAQDSGSHQPAERHLSPNEH